jgi:histidine decarboxylase
MSAINWQYDKTMFSTVPSRIASVPIVRGRTNVETRRMIRKQISTLVDRVDEAMDTQLGYPITRWTGIDHSLIEPATGFQVNNVGDPASPAILGLNTHGFELGILDFFAEMWNILPDDAWGYVTSGSSESILQSLFVARQHYPDGVLYCSQACHYSVFKAAKILGLETVTIPVDFLGRVSYETFERSVASRADRPAICVLTAGTTMTGAIDHPAAIEALLERQGVTDRYIHLDTALMGCVLPFVDGFDDVVSFSHPAVSAISTSGHKFLGNQTPCGVLLMRREFTSIFDEEVEYVHMKDMTLLCSRNGHSAVSLWSILSQVGLDGLSESTATCMENASWLVYELTNMGIRSYLLNGSITVVFDRPSEEIVRKWQLAVQGPFAHVVVMPGVSQEILQAFLDDLREMS